MNKSLLTVVTSLLLLAACTGGGPQQPGIGSPFIGGNVGLNLYLQDGAPPPQVFDGGKFPFAVNIVVENVGEADVGVGTDNPYVTSRIEGINPTSFGLVDADLEKELDVPLRGARKNFDGTIIGGLIANFVFEGLNFQGDLQGNDLLTLRGTVCYDYENTATTQLCFKNDIIESVQDATICTLTGEKIVHNSGGPLHVSQVIQNPLGENKVQVNFVIEHVGPGEFYGREADESCNPSVRNTNKFRTDVEVFVEDPSAVVKCYRLGSSDFGTLTMYNGAPQTVTCTVEGSSTKARVYTDIMTINLAYRYGQFIEQPIIIQALPQDIE